MTALVQGDPSRSYEAGLISRVQVSDDSLELVFQRPDDFAFSPGQCIRITHEAGERDYSLISAPQEPHLAVLIKVVEGGALTPVLAGASLGTSFFF